HSLTLLTYIACLHPSPLPPTSPSLPTRRSSDLYNTGEVMVTPETDKKYFDIVLGFTAEIGLVPVPVLKETPGYLLNGLLVPWLSAGAELYVNGIANPADIDNVWRTATGSPAGPVQVYDTVGFNVAANI